MVMGEPSRDQDLWQSLLLWLGKHGMKVDAKHLLVECRDVPGAGKGLFVLRDVDYLEAVTHQSNGRPRQDDILFTVPARALINVVTLKSLYPPAVPGGQELLPWQTITLHLLLHKPHDDGISRDPLFGPFISTMPQEFSSHPCTWSIKQSLPFPDRWFPMEDRLLQVLPPSVKRSLQELMLKVRDGWATICDYVRNRPTILGTASRGLRLGSFRPDNNELILDYLWAFLNVNTRCIHYRIDPSVSSPRNVTLCPVLDFANHTPQHTDIVPVLRSSNHSYASGGDYTFKANHKHKLLAGQQVFLRYGGHANRTLFTEYGFVNLEKRDPDGEVDVQDLVEAMFEKVGNATWIKQVLEEENYWGDWTLHSSPSPPHPSYRLIIALRLLHCSVAGNSEPDANWKKVIQGEIEQISEENERSWRSSVVIICEQLIARAKLGLESVQALDSGMDETADWFHWMQTNIQILWQEELDVANGVAQSIESGEIF